MLLTMLKAKIHHAKLTMTDLHYEGSIGIDEDYALPAARGSKEFMLNGAAARMASVGDQVIIAAYGQIPAEEARNYKPTVLLMNEDNSIARQM